MTFWYLRIQICGSVLYHSLTDSDLVPDTDLVLDTDLVPDMDFHFASVEDL